MLKFENTEAYLKAFADRVLQQAQLELGAYRTVDGKRRRIDSTGRLRESLPGSYSLKVMANSIGLNFFDNNDAWKQYGYVVDQGRKAGKGVPPDALKAWIRQKPIRLRDLKTGSFVKQTEAGVNSLAYLINRKIKQKGIAPTYFFQTPFRIEFQKLPSEITEPFSLDVENFLRTTLKDVSNEIEKNK
jgi:hypothetical protein